MRNSIPSKHIIANSNLLVLIDSAKAPLFYYPAITLGAPQQTIWYKDRVHTISEELPRAMRYPNIYFISISMAVKLEHYWRSC